MKYFDSRLKWDYDRWPHFSPKELACKCCGELWEDNDPSIPSRWVKHLDGLEVIRGMINEPMIITSGHRCIYHNAKVGGAKSSQHLILATDIVCRKDLQKEFIRAAELAGFTGIGRYPNKNFVHLDLGANRRWKG